MEIIEKQIEKLKKTIIILGLLSWIPACTLFALHAPHPSIGKILIIFVVFPWWYLLMCCMIGVIICLMVLIYVGIKSVFHS